jgi:uncharacterized protein (TIGR02145 family)
LTALSANTTYYIRAYASNSIGTAYGQQESLIAKDPTDGTLTDYDGNTYKWIKIGTQIWMASNLKVTHYPNGNAIPLVTGQIGWRSLLDNDTDDAYCYLQDESTSPYVLYTYASAINACPTGWHLPSDAEWTTLENYISNDGHLGTEGTALKATSGWLLENNGTDDYGFSALPGGYRYSNYGTFWSDYSGWWSNTNYGDSSAYTRGMMYDDIIVLRQYYNKSRGVSIRCVRD